ncbi:MAG TPA: MBL fold metallo-hydrolase [Bryobacteraceae bacterium]|nr:MBL fold metallo-hydrolase [Bryobacteraceae bacterium]
MPPARFIPLSLFLSAVVFGQTPDTGTAHKAAATALLNSNNSGAAHLACPATVFPEPSATPPGGGPARGGLGPGGRAQGGPGQAADAQGAGRAGGRGGPGRGATPPRENWYAEGGQVFDNLYMLTTKVNSAWAVKTSEGIILIDTLFGYAAQDEIVNGMKKLGLNPADIKYIVISHAHGDHDGAVKFLQDTYHPHVILAPKDWELAARQANPYTHDMDATDGQKLTLGDTTITVYITPGHTGGTLSFLVPVKDHGVPHMAMEWGGTALSGNTSKEMLQSYISNASRLLDIADGAGADVIIGNHTEYNDALPRLEQTKARRPSDPNPWVVGKPEVRKYLTVVQECAKSWLAIGEGRR